MTIRLLIAYLLMALLAGGLAGAVWWATYNSPHQRMKRYYRAKRQQGKR